MNYTVSLRGTAKGSGCNLFLAQCTWIIQLHGVLEGDCKMQYHDWGTCTQNLLHAHCTQNLLLAHQLLVSFDIHSFALSVATLLLSHLLRWHTWEIVGMSIGTRVYLHNGPNSPRYGQTSTKSRSCTSQVFKVYFAGMLILWHTQTHTHTHTHTNTHTVTLIIISWLDLQLKLRLARRSAGRMERKWKRENKDLKKISSRCKHTERTQWTEK
jgi:hypothetical protein